jgi:TM2 domain-containing membrane protein YozV
MRAWLVLIVVVALLWLCRWDYHFITATQRYRVNRYTGWAEICWGTPQSPFGQTWQPVRSDATSLAALHGGPGLALPFDPLEALIILPGLGLLLYSGRLFERSRSGYRRCAKCKLFIPAVIGFCSSCGWNQRAPFPPPPTPAPRPPRAPSPANTARSRHPRERWIATVLALLLGGLGVHRFYLGHLGWGLAYAVFCWTFIPAIIAACEVIWLVCMSDDEFDRRFNTSQG